MFKTLHFSITLFISAFLLFLIQPILSKLILPLWGGSSEVWNTAMFFFQFLLLLGYLYGHLLTKYFPKKQFFIHLTLVFVCCVFKLPVTSNIEVDVDVNKLHSLHLFKLLFDKIGLLFLLISATAPLLQKWFAYTRVKHADDPYFLYGASNLGSILALVTYPIVIEPLSTISAQLYSWSNIYVFLLLLFFSLIIPLRKYFFKKETTSHTQEVHKGNNKINLRLVLSWIALAFLPSSLLLGVTSELTNIVPSTPLLWVIPLLIYLLSFVIVFRKSSIVNESRMILILNYIIISVLTLQLYKSIQVLVYFPVINLVLFFIITMVCLMRLYKLRPSTEHITIFYLWLSVGGVLGSLFNSIISVQIFDTLFEYPLVAFIALFIIYSSKELKDIEKKHLIVFLLVTILFLVY